LVVVFLLCVLRSRTLRRASASALAEVALRTMARTARLRAATQQRVHHRAAHDDGLARRLRHRYEGNEKWSKGRRRTARGDLS
jgi:hypothetical protein